MATEVSVDYEPLPGYRLIQHIGDGGYGEVWLAEAPGGLTKAIKFVYGRQDEKRARSELRALEKVRSLRHPFLLSLERIEAVDGRLLIVSELADESIRDRFESYRQQGMPGIPREELLNCLRDAADALDYLSARHALQHLDIKPENLLLVAGHVKVADYGLVKSVQQTQASLVGGMTPLYSAPEVFRGTPSRRSDQYSLAILYQEMLTGAIPFAGGNAAELTLQHLNDEPELSSLCSADRCIVSRALAKEPEHRYPTCLEFIDALRNVSADGAASGRRDKSTSSTSSSASLCDTAPRSGSRTEIFGEDASLGSGSEPLLIELPPGGAVTDLPPLEVKESDFRPSPTLVLGIGGAAGHVLAHLRRGLAEQFGNAESLPAVQMLLIDTDPKALALISKRDAAGLKPEETLSVPLHRPQHYREQSDQLLRWLGRRWLYNVPRSLRTEGLRPLGRLALADHARQVYQRIRLAVTQAFDAESVETSDQTTDRSWRNDAARVYVVASISGGTGSGMSLDLGYAVQTILAKLEMANARIVGLMLHSTGHEPRHCELARVNAFSWLTEFHHFSRPESAYPGDVSCGLPAQERGKQPYNDTYLVHLGDSLNADDFDAATQSVADYLLLDMLTPAQSFFDQCRESVRPEEDGAAHSGGSLRSFGVYRKTAASTDQRDELAQLVCQHVLTSWQNVNAQPKTSPIGEPGDANEPAPESENGTEPVVQGAVQLVGRLQLEPAAIAANVRTLMEATLGCDASEYLSSWLADPANASLSDEPSRFAAIDQIINDAQSDGNGDGQLTVLGQPLGEITQPLEEKLRVDVRRWVVGRLDDPQERLAGARRAVAWLDQHFRAVEKAVAHLGRNTAAKLSELQNTAGQALLADQPAEEHQPIPSPEERLAMYFRLRMDLLAFLAAGDMTRRFLADLKAVAEQLTALGRELQQITSTLLGNMNSAASEQPSEHQTESPDGDRALRSRLPEIAAAVEQRLQAEFLAQNGGLLETVLRGGRQRAQFGALLQEFARQAVYEAICNVDVVADMLREGDKDEADESPLRMCLASATPPALKFGGARRVLAVLPKDRKAPVDTAKLSQALGANVSLTTGYDCHLQLCVEAEQLSLPHVAVDIVQHRKDCTDFARRVHTRTDIAWTPLINGNINSLDGKGSNLDVLSSLADPMAQATQMISCNTH